VSGATGTVTSPGGRLGRGAINLIAAFALLYLFAPIFVIIAFSFNKPKGRFNAIWQQFTFENWLHPFANHPLNEALLLSLRIAFISTAIATVLGTFIAIALVRYRIRGGEPVNFLLVLPLTAPEIVLGASLLTLFIRPTMLLFNHNFALGTTTIVIAHIMFLVSYVAITVRARVRGIDWTLEDAAMDLGASPARTFWKVTLPLITPGILAAALLAFALSIDDFIITYFVSGPNTTTFPVRIFNQSRTATPPQINVLSTMILLVSIMLLAAGTAWGAYRQNRTT
jgi:spermidine/putrescine transport system permease protein